MGLMRKPSYRMALLKFINMVKKKKTKGKGNLSTIFSEGGDEDNASEACLKHKIRSLRLNDEHSVVEDNEDNLPTINEYIEKRPLIAGRLVISRR